MRGYRASPFAMPPRTVLVKLRAAPRPIRARRSAARNIAVCCAFIAASLAGQKPAPRPRYFKPQPQLTRRRARRPRARARQRRKKRKSTATSAQQAIKTMEIDDAPEEPAPPLGPGPKLGTVVAMVDFRPPAETGQQPYYQDPTRAWRRSGARPRPPSGASSRPSTACPRRRGPRRRRCRSSAARRSSAWAIRK